MIRIILSCMIVFMISAPAFSKEVSFTDIIENVVASLDKQLQKKYGTAVRYIPMIVTTPVNLNNFSQTNALARQVGQEVITQLVKREYRVEEVRHAKEITSFVDIGEFILSRGKEINTTYKIGLVVAGTYTTTGTGVRFTAEVININDSSIAAMESATLLFTREIESLLLQQNTTKPTQRIPTTETRNASAPAQVVTIPNDTY